MADRFQHFRQTFKRPFRLRSGDVRARFPRRFPFILLGLFYTFVVLGIALLVGTFLYETARTYSFASRPLPNLEFEVHTLLNVETAIGELDSPTEVLQTNGVENASELVQRVLPQKRINILLLGTDERPDENGPPRTDTIMLMTMDLEHQMAGLLSLPRDMWVPIPGYDIATKINTAYAIGEMRRYPGGGPQLVKDTVSSFVGRPVEYYVQINFNGFVRFVDLIGGIDVYVPHTIHDDRYPTPDYGVELFRIEAGHHHLDGETALKYVRTRQADSDYKRAGRQQQVLQAVLDKVLAADMIPMLVAKSPQLMATMRDSFETDIPLPVIMEIANYARKYAPSEPLRQLVLDANYGEETYSSEGAWILLPDRSRVREALNQFFAPGTADGAKENLVMPEDRLPAGATQDKLSQDLSPGRQDHTAVKLEVLNGTGRAGVAAQIREQLQKQGWQVVSIGDADRSDYRRTLIVNYNADRSLVDQIHADLKLPANLPALHGLIISDTVDIRIIVGQDFVKDVLERPGR
jgi:polyisoprenyl-teichoic acid--peptidoglycan teichoic acid transferase